MIGKSSFDLVNIGLAGLLGGAWDVGRWRSLSRGPPSSNGATTPRAVVHQSHQRRYHRPVIEALIPLLVGTLVLVFQLPFADRLLAEFTPSPRPRERLLVRAIVVVIALALIVLGVARLVSN
jgi:hypothetical protein